MPAVYRHDTLLAEGETDWVFVDAHTGRPRVIPKTVSGAFTALPEDEEPPSLEP